MGWVMVHIAGRLERQRQERYVKRFGEQAAESVAPLPMWVQSVRGWLLSERRQEPLH
jgi:hypothetical protein